jgi:hypothetical protein
MVTFLDTTNRQVMGRYAVISTEPLTSIRLALGNFLSNGVSDGAGATGSTSTVTASIEYPSGTCTQVKLLGSTSFTIANGDLVFTDYQTVSIPTNTTFWVRQFITNPSGVLYYPFQDSFYNESTNGGVSGIADQTVSCDAIPNTYTAGNPQVAGIPPLAVLAMTIHASTEIVGDSIARRGVEGTTGATGNNGKVGIIAQSMGSAPFLNLSVDGETAKTWTTRATARKKMVSKGSSLIVELGVNDLDTWNETASQVITDLQSIYALAHVGQKIFQTTITPHTSDPGTPAAAWTTTGQQTAINPTTHASLNQAIRAGLSGISGFYNAASVFETSQDSDIWEVSPQCPASTCTGDGLHPDSNGLTQILNSGVIPVQTYP